MAHYVNVSAQDMEAFLGPQGFTRLDLGDSTIELVFGKRVDQDGIQLSLRVYTGINPTGESRSVGSDAMRVNIFMRTSEGRIIKLGGSKRVHRVEGWRANLQQRIDRWVEYMPQHRCEVCGLPMLPRERKGGKGKFLGCAGYPNCRNTRNIPND
jgi:hypothetical protein